MILTCKCCGENFAVRGKEEELIKEGFTQKPDLCDECFEMQERSEPSDFYEFSDADPGL